jgi:MFS family permease
MLSRNAKLYLLGTIVRGLGNGIWGVIFNLYLKQVGFQPDFIGNVFTAGGIATGFIALPAGLLCERAGLKKALIIGEMVNFASLTMIVVLEPSVLLFASFVSGLIGTVGWVASAPFMMENSSSQERTFLFSLDWTMMIIMGVIGSYLGGIMPSLLNAFFGTPGSVDGYRITLFASIGLASISLFTVLLMKENKTAKKQRTLDLLSLRNVRNWKTIFKFMVPVGVIGFGAGFIVPLFNLFFKLKFVATDEQIGLMSALSNVTLGIGTIAAPALVRKVGKVRSVALCEFLSMPFIMLTTLAPNLPFAATAYVTRNALMNMAGPINMMFQMEMVSKTERATTNGFMVMADNIPRAVTASISGVMMTGNDFFTPFLFTTATYLVASSLYYAFFRKAESRTNEKTERSA